MCSSCCCNGGGMASLRRSVSSLSEHSEAGLHQIVFEPLGTQSSEYEMTEFSSNQNSQPSHVLGKSIKLMVPHPVRCMKRQILW